MLLIIGSVAFDTIITPFGKTKDALGGSATYASLAAAFYNKPGIVAVAGTDFSQKYEKVFLDKKINISGLEKAKGKTFRWGGTYGFDLNSRETNFTELNVFEHFKPKLSEKNKNAEFLFLGNIHPALQREVLEQIRQPKFIALDTMNYWIENSRAELLKTLQQIDLLVINDSEARELTKEHNVLKSAKAILKMLGRKKNTLPTLIIKRGEYGLLMLRKNEAFYLPAYPLEDVVDPTGAGDSFAGGFMGYLSQTKDISWENLKRACVAGSVTASFSVEELGTKRLQSLTPQEIKTRFGYFKKLTSFEME